MYLLQQQQLIWVNKIFIGQREVHAERQWQWSHKTMIPNIFACHKKMIFHFELQKFSFNFKTVVSSSTLYLVIQCLWTIEWNKRLFTSILKYVGMRLNRLVKHTIAILNAWLPLPNKLIILLLHPRPSFTIVTNLFEPASVPIFITFDFTIINSNIPNTMRTFTWADICEGVH